MSIKTENVTIEKLIDRVKEYDNSVEDANLIRSAYEYAYRKHFSQKRITKEQISKIIKKISNLSIHFMFQISCFNYLFSILNMLF